MAKEYYIPDRPSVNIKIDDTGFVIIDAHIINSEAQAEFVNLELPAETAKEMAEAILKLLRDE